MNAHQPNLIENHDKHLPSWFNADTAPDWQTSNVARGKHPMGGKLLIPGSPNTTCGTCRHRKVLHYAKKYHKCELFTANTSGAATDIRVRWPACAKWEKAHAKRP